MLRDISYRLQAWGARLVMVLFRALPLDTASWFGGFLARHIGPISGAHKTARRNLQLALPDKTEAERREILAGMWDNIGRTLGEYPHLGVLMNDPERVEVVDRDNLIARLRDDGIGAALIGMHAGNWELSTLPGHRAGLNQYHFYRAPNNPYVDVLLNELRAPMQQEGYLAKGAEGARRAVALLRRGEHVGMLIDQKQDEGIAAPFFGRDAMTTTAPGSFARRLDVPMVSARVVRLNGARFRIFVKELEVVKTADRMADVVTITKQINLLLESWIRETPGQWFWVHRRWPK